MTLIPFGFNLGLRWALRCLWDGATVVVLSPKLANAQGTFETVDRHGVDTIMATPRHLSVLLEDLKGDGLRLPNLRCLAVTSAALSDEVFAACTQAHLAQHSAHLRHQRDLVHCRRHWRLG